MEEVLLLLSMLPTWAVRVRGTGNDIDFKGGGKKKEKSTVQKSLVDHHHLIFLK